MKQQLDEKIKSHLATYKKNKLKIVEDGIWWKNKKSYPHILPKEKYSYNIIDIGFRQDLLAMLNLNDLHLGFNHLNSSQALAVNLLGPLIITQQLTLVGHLLQIDIDASCEYKFEYIENANENTNFDFFLKMNDKKIYFEVKYTENQFGGAKKDAKHQEKYLTIYKDRLDRIANISENEFYKNYQLWRNIIYSEDGIVVFVLPDFRKDLIETVEAAIRRTNHRERIKILRIEDLVDSCQKNETLKTR